MLLDRTHRGWSVCSLVVLAASILAYVAYVRSSPHGPSGGSRMGLLFGVAGAAMMLFAFLIALRRRVPAWRVGSAAFWLRGHIWLGTLAVPMVLFHSGFRLGGPLESLLMALFGLVVLSGVFGLAMQQFMPRRMLQSVPLETFIEQVPFVTRRNQILCDQAVAAQCGPLELVDDPLMQVAASLCGRAATASREAKENWLGAVAPDWHPLLRSLARYAKNEGWKGMRQESDFPKALEAIYALPARGNGQQPGSAAAGSASSEPSPRADDEPPESAKGRPAGTVPRAATLGETRPPMADSPAGTAKAAPSKIEQMRAAARAKAAGAVPPGPSADAPSQAQVATPATEAPAGAAPAAPVAPAASAAKPAPARKPAAATADQPPAPVEPPPRAAQLKQFYLNRVRPFLYGAPPAGELTSEEGAFRLFNVQRAELPNELHDLLNRIEAFCTERRQLLLLHKLRRWLHAWLAVHVPLSVALMVLLVWHVLLALKVVPLAVDS